MTLIDWLASNRGRLTALAVHFGLTQSAVSQWRANGVPPHRMKAVRDFTEGGWHVFQLHAGQLSPQPLQLVQQQRPFLPLAALYLAVTLPLSWLSRALERRLQPPPPLPVARL